MTEAWNGRRRPRAAQVAAAALLNLALLAGLLATVDRVRIAAPPERSGTLVLSTLAPVRREPDDPPPKPAQRPRATARPATPAPPRAAAPITMPAPAPAITPEPAAVAATLPASAASQPRLDLDSASVRQAIHDVARHPSISGIARADDPAPSGRERLAQGLTNAQKGDCSKGEFAGGGGGLLSLPFYVLAEATGQCAK